LQTVVETGFHELHRRHDDSERRSEKRHEQNTVRLNGINGRVGEAHEKLARHDGWIQSLQTEFARVRERVHELVNRLQTRPDGKFEDGHVSRLELRWLVVLIVSCFSAGAGVMAWILKLVGIM